MRLAIRFNRLPIMLIYRHNATQPGAVREKIQDEQTGVAFGSRSRLCFYGAETGVCGRGYGKGVHHETTIGK